MSLFLRTLAEFHRRALGWAAVAAVFGVGYVVIYDSLVADIPLEIVPLAGYLELTVYGLMPPLLVVLCAIGLGARAVAGIEETGELELLLAGPIGRRRLVLTRYAGFAASIALAGLTIWAVVQWFVFVGRIGIDTAHVAAACAGLVLVGLFFGSMSFAAGAFTGDRAVALALAGGVATVAYTLRALADTAEEARAMRWLSPFHYHLSDYWPPHPAGPGGYEVLLILLTAALLTLAVYGFGRRDVGTEPG
ncbi:ABC transporter permease subunit [Catenuloplanes atrovinosus]|uniref:ABC-2 type transport system permease protein n=1 Tax=Catenuloplanes atrovinosus TaxID=137266 RepID=A0AAE4CEA6_9ACTN|nr:ABC transporter permease subunit [Catenuloplanes atrovinosus]MDR7278415.1 ABC-2 type transport system permease protein [Catenuloplanes atrovinosus]